MITLGIIGIVAAMTLPTLINNTKWKQYEVRFAVAQNLFANAVQNLQAQGLMVNGQYYGSAYCVEAGNCTEGQFTTFTDLFAKAFKDINALNDKSQKYYSGKVYKNFSNTATFKTSMLDDGYMELIKGMSVIIETNTKTQSPILFFDIDGSGKGPNRMGVDTFAFIVDENGKVCPVGSPLCSLQYARHNGAQFDVETTTDYTQSRYCSPGSNADTNGVTCGYFASVDKDYFKKVMK